MKKKDLFILSSLLGSLIGVAGMKLLSIKSKNKEEDKYKELSEKHLTILKLFNQWMIVKQAGKSVADYLHMKKIKTVAIYGMSYVGERLYDELKTSDIEVKYAIDQNADNIYSELNIITPENSLEAVDAVLVTSIYYYDMIEDMLSEKVEGEILSLENILYELCV